MSLKIPLETVGSPLSAKADDAAGSALRRQLDAGQWRQADAAFASNLDPLAGTDLKQGFERLHATIVSITPAPLGLGPALR